MLYRNLLFQAMKHGFKAKSTAITPIYSCFSSQKRHVSFDANKVSLEHDNQRRVYSWVTEEAETLIAKNYARHQVELVLPNYKSPLSIAELESLKEVHHYKPVTALDYLAYGTMRFLRIFTHLFFAQRYHNHAVVLETVAAVPGTVASAFRHLRSLRTMTTDHGWITPLQEEAENERMHLLIWMEYVRPTFLERSLVILAQVVYTGFYSGLYIFSPQSAHRMVGYLEEEAHLSYNAFLNAIDEGKLPNAHAPLIAIKYYNLPDSATIRDVVLRVRADECMHRDFNHHLANKIKAQDVGSKPVLPGGLGEQ